MASPGLTVIFPRFTVRSGTQRARAYCGEHLIRRSGQVVQDRPSPVVRWADIPHLSPRVSRCPVAWQQYWQQLQGTALTLDLPLSGVAHPESGRDLQVCCAAAESLTPAVGCCCCCHRCCQPQSAERRPRTDACSDPRPLIRKIGRAKTGLGTRAGARSRDVT